MKKLILFVLFTSVCLMAQFQNIRVNSASSTDPEEVTIAINPFNPLQLAAGANIKYLYYSNDGGLTWTQKNMSSSLGVWGDPCVIYDVKQNLYFGHLSNPMSGYWIDRIVVQKSTNNGLTWDDGGVGIGLQAPKNQDKEWLAVDLHSPLYKGNVYTTWTEFDNYGSASSTDSSRILFSRTTNEGLTWSTSVKVSDVSGNCIDEDMTVEGAVPTVGLNGEIYVAWSGPLGIMFDRSTNGGLTFGTDIFVSTQPGGWDLTIPGINRANGMPITMCDTSKAPTRGNVYVVWGDQRAGTDNSDVFLIKSTNGGTTWGSTVKVNQDNTTRHQFFPWSVIDQTTGYIYVVFYDRRNTTGVTTDVYVARSTDGGDTFTDFKVSQSSFTPTASVFFGDYTNIAAYNRKIYPFWMRLDNQTLSVWTAIIQDTTGLPVELSGFDAKSDNDIVTLNWMTTTETNNRGFEIERAFVQDNVVGEFHLVGFVNGAGTTTEIKYYSFGDKLDKSGIYKYRLKQMDFDGKYKYSNEVEVSALLTEFALLQNYPNPFNPSTIISYKLAKPGFVTLKVFDVLGNEITTLVNKFNNAGVHEVDFSGKSLSSGVYLYRITTEEFTSEKKMLLVK